MARFGEEMRPEGTVKARWVWRSRWNMYVREEHDEGSEVGHEPAILNDSKETVGVGERSNIKWVSVAES